MVKNVGEGVKIIVYAFVTVAVEICGQFDVPAALPPEENLVHLEKVIGWALQSVWTVLQKKNELLLLSGIEPCSPLLQPSIW
jgi:hypothetical protein